jgi:hypothetical protein
MKLRINVYPIGGFRFGVERKRWFGWVAVYKADVLDYCKAYIKDISEIRKVEWVKD